MDKINILAESLKEQGYIVNIFSNKEEASEFLNGELDNKTIGIGGSQTVEQMKLYDSLAVHNTVYWHDHKPEEMTVMEARQAAFRAPVYISSVNAVSILMPNNFSVNLQDLRDFAMSGVRAGKLIA